MKLTNHQKTIIASQCAGQIGLTIFSSGVLLSYSQSLGFSSPTILILLALPELMGCIMLLPFAYYTGRIGIKLIGVAGITLGIFGFILIIAASFLETYKLYLAFGGVALLGIGHAMFNSGWLALLGPLMEKSTRGKFLGALRFSWQLASIGFTIIALGLIRYLPGNNSIYIIILSAIVFFQLVRLVLYKRIPDQTEKESEKATLSSVVVSLVKTPVFMSYCCYLFFLTLFTAACPWIINLEQSKFLHFSGSQIIFVNTLFLLGNLVGYYYGGILTDKHGTKPIFILTHFSYGALLLLFVGRDFLFVPPIYSHSVLMFAFGFVVAASSIAITAELYDVIPVKNALISTSFFTVVVSSSKFLGAFVSSQALSLKLLTEEWTIGPFSMNCYDTMLIANAIMVVLLVMTLGLIPSVSKQIHQINNQ